MNGHPLTSIDYHEDLGITFDCILNFHQQTIGRERFTRLNVYPIEVFPEILSCCLG